MNSQDLEKKYRQFVVTLNNFLYKKQIDNALNLIEKNINTINLIHCNDYVVKDPSFYIGSVLCDNEINLTLINQLNPTILDLFKGSIYSNNIMSFSNLIKYYKNHLIENTKLNDEMNNYLNYKLKNADIAPYKKILKEEGMENYNFNLSFWLALVNGDFQSANALIQTYSNINYNYQNVSKYDNHVFHQISYAWDETEENINKFEKVCHYFINQNFNANITNKWDNTILNSMVRIRKYTFAKIFLNTLYPKEEINIKNTSGKTILHSLFYDKSLSFYIKQVVINQSNQAIFLKATDFIVDMVKLGADLDLPSGLHNRGKSIRKILEKDNEILVFLEKKQLENVIIANEKTLNSSNVKKNKGKI